MLGYLICISLSNKYIHLSFTNATFKKEIEVTYSIDDQSPQIKTIESSIIPMEFLVHQSFFGKHTIQLSCAELDLYQSLEVFTFKNNYISFEIQQESTNSPKVLTRYSWFPLVYM